MKKCLVSVRSPFRCLQGVTATVDGQTVTAKGPKGELKFVVNDEVLVKIEDSADRCPRRATDSKDCSRQSGACPAR